MDNIPGWLGEKESTRKFSGKQEKRLAKTFNGKLTSNSGATFGQNDIESREFSIESKITAKKSYSISVDEFEKLIKRTPNGKIPVEVITFDKANLDLAVIRLENLLELFRNQK